MATLLLVHMAAGAQFTYFAYLQSEDAKTFTVTLQKKTYNSSPAGHVILPGLASGTYDITVAMAGENSRQEYRIQIQENDAGFLIKKYDEKYGLLNLLTTEIQLSGAQKQAEQQAAAEAARLEREKAEQEAQAKLAKEAAEREAAEQARREQAAREDALRQQKAAKAAAQQAQQAAAEQAARETAQTEAAKQAAAEKAQQQQQAAAEQAARASTLSETEKKAADEKALKAKQEEEIRRFNQERRKQLEAEEAARKAAAQSATTTPPPADRPLTPAEIAQLQEEARKIDARGKRDSVLKVQSLGGSQQPKFLDMDFTMETEAQDNKASKKDSVPPTPAAPATTGANHQPPVPVPDKSAWADTIQSAPPAKAIETIPATPTPIPRAGVDTLKVTGGTAAPIPAPASEEVKKAEQAPGTEATTNPNCTATATQEEVDLIGLLIKAEKNADDALDVVRKFVRLKCVSARQVRSMAAHFADQEGKYRLLDMCYRFATDQAQYAALANLLTDSYYLNRFKAMLQ